MLDIEVLSESVRLTEHLEAPARRFGIGPEGPTARNPLQVLFAQVHVANLRPKVEQPIRANPSRGQ
jgi:hypothetical protein